MGTVSSLTSTKFFHYQFFNDGPQKMLLPAFEQRRSAARKQGNMTKIVKRLLEEDTIKTSSKGEFNLREGSAHQALMMQSLLGAVPALVCLSLRECVCVCLCVPELIFFSGF